MVRNKKDEMLVCLRGGSVDDGEGGVEEVEAGKTHISPEHFRDNEWRYRDHFDPNVTRPGSGGIRTRTLTPDGQIADERFD
jgi:hypothetical protein